MNSTAQNDCVKMVLIRRKRHFICRDNGHLFLKKTTSENDYQLKLFDKSWHKVVELFSCRIGMSAVEPWESVVSQNICESIRVALNRYAQRHTFHSQCSV